MLGRKAGVVTKLAEKYTSLFSWHCLNHRLELGVNDAVREVTAINHFKCFLDTLYSLYSQSNKNQRELTEASHELEANLLRIGRVLDVRWISSSFRTVKAVWTSHKALAHHFQCATNDILRDGIEKKKYSGLLARLASVEFVSDLGLMYDALNELSQLSLELQSRTMTIPRSQVLIKRTIRVLQSFKESPGEKMSEALLAKQTHVLNGVVLRDNNKLKCVNPSQFLQSLINNLTQRLCNEEQRESEFLLDLDVMEQSKWPQNPSIRFGEKEIKRLCLRFRLDAEKAIRGMRELLEEPGSHPDDLQPLSLCIRTIPCSSAECERDFSLMNIIETDRRSSLLVRNVSSLMFININGPPLSLFNCKTFVKSWKAHHRSANELQSRQCKTADLDDHDVRRPLWNVCNSA